jgi:hypothetical protein
MARMVAIWVAVHHRAASSREHRPTTLVQLEPIRTATTRAANAVGTRDHRYRSSNASNNATGRRWISVHRGEREDPSQAGGTDGLGRLTAWVSLSLTPRVRDERAAKSPVTVCVHACVGMIEAGVSSRSQRSTRRAMSSVGY